MGFLFNKKTVVLSTISFVAVVLVVIYFVGDYSLNQISQNNAIDDLTNYSSQVTSNLANRNITTELTDNLTKTVAEINLAVGTEGSLAVPTGLSLDKITSSVVGDFNPADFKPVINDSDIIISNDVNSIALKTYFQNFQDIILNNSVIENLSSYSSVNDATRIISESYQTTINQFYNLTVPKNLTNFHKEEIALLSGKLSALQTIEEYNADPIKSLIAFEASSYFDDQLTILKDSINKFLITNNITF